jgi:formate hydrogenlyase subunit 4
MSLISLLFSLIIVGVVMWLINTYIPMDGKIKKILSAVVAIIVTLWLLGAFGIIGPMSTMHIGNMHLR